MQTGGRERKGVRERESRCDGEERQLLHDDASYRPTLSYRIAVHLCSRRGSKHAPPNTHCPAYAARCCSRAPLSDNHRHSSLQHRGIPTRAAPTRLFPETPFHATTSIFPLHRHLPPRASPPPPAAPHGSQRVLVDAHLLPCSKHVHNASHSPQYTPMVPGLLLTRVPECEMHERLKSKQKMAGWSVTFCLH